MLSFIYLASALLLGTAITRWLKIRFVVFEAPAMAIGLGLIVWTWLSFLCALILPYAFSLPLTIGLSTGLSIILWRSTSAWRWHAWSFGRGSTIAWMIFTVATTGLIGSLMWTHYLISTPEGLVSANATWADFGLHSSLISHFAFANGLSLDFPVAAGAKLTYPFMVDLFSAWLLQGGWSLHMALFVPSLLLIAAFLQLIVGFGVRLFHSLGGAILGLTVMLLSGSAAGIFAVTSDLKQSALPVTEFLSHLPYDYTTLTVPNAQVSNLIADIILPQRGFLMGFAAFGVAIILFTALHHRASRLTAIFTGAFIGLLPLVHAHTYVILMALLTSQGISAWIHTKHVPRAWLFAGAASLSIAIPQILWQSLANGNGTGGFFSPGWVIRPGESLIMFWAHNYGLTGIIIIGLITILTFYLPLRKYLMWYAPFVVVFIAANLYSLQPFAYDNLKLIVYVYLITYIFAAYGAIWIVRRNRYASLPIMATILLLVSSGTLAVAREFQHKDLFASTDDIELAAWVRAATEPSDVFIATDRPNQPVATLTGRSVVLGYRGWLYDYHLDYEPRVVAVQSALSAQMSVNNSYKAQYLAVSNFEPAEWIIDRPALNVRYKKIFTNASWTIYRL